MHHDQSIDMTERTVHQLRELEESDYPQVIESVDEWWGGRSMAAMLPRLFFKHFQDTSFVAELDGKLTGFLVGFVSASKPNEGYVHFVGVDPEHRQAGIARALYEAFFKTVQEKGCLQVGAVTSPINARSIAFHKAIGFSTVPSSLDQQADVHKDYDGPGEDRVLFIREL
ncbi:GNAT family N-acetyltransferase [Alloalcanivorax xenomutans]|uniref:GNAT family N-acetyltransferase n=1 Tax=Alloalcanivorax xenomutans TaxID=1094342 RepID=UPI00292EBD8B|nr:GNAT family N-acetyltransferase [Alloalcanivorax xenomutans]WOA31779.1 GNAT family N-acetyltransferase [Alloalcanivorax xenomutans]